MKIVVDNNAVPNGTAQVLRKKEQTGTYITRRSEQNFKNNIAIRVHAGIRQWIITIRAIGIMQISIKNQKKSQISGGL